MKWLLYMVLLLVVILLPVEATDVGELIPVEVIAVSEDRGTIIIEADTGDWGQGSSITAAINNMEDTAAGIIYLDTAEYLILEEGIPPEVMRPYLKDDVRVCYAEEGITLEGIANYLSVHQPEVTLKRVSESSRIPWISQENGRFQLKEE